MPDVARGRCGRARRRATPARPWRDTQEHREAQIAAGRARFPSGSLSSLVPILFHPALIGSKPHSTSSLPLPWRQVCSPASRSSLANHLLPSRVRGPRLWVDPRLVRPRSSTTRCVAASTPPLTESYRLFFARDAITIFPLICGRWWRMEHGAVHVENVAGFRIISILPVPARQEDWIWFHVKRI
jgi:hypothetical protein